LSSPGKQVGATSLPPGSWKKSGCVTSSTAAAHSPPPRPTSAPPARRMPEASPAIGPTTVPGSP